ncbi:MAG: hypothetical protein AAFQ63_13905 [Cyanobacteria bacterium J06621_11]
MGKKIAVDGEVEATPSSMLLQGANSGQWMARKETLQCTPASKLTVKGTAAISQAKCIFQFTGTTPSGAPILSLDSVTLSPKSTKLTDGGQSLLVVGDSSQSPMGNKLEVKDAAGNLTTS